MWRSTLLALATLIFVLGIAVAVMLGVGHLLHVLFPAKHFDVFYALHRPVVRWCLIAVSALWLLPPHPWARRLVDAVDRDAPHRRPRARHARIKDGRALRAGARSTTAFPGPGAQGVGG